MTRRLAALFVSCFVVAACSLSLPFEELTRDGPPTDAGLDGALDTDVEADAAEDASVDAIEDAAIDAVLDADASVDVDTGSTCTNKVLDPDESDTDCGGSSSCARCGPNRKCTKGTDCLSGHCESLRCSFCPPGMIRVPIGTQGYCIDTTEVTVDAYKAFASKTTPKDLTLPSACKWKTAFSSGSGGAGTLPVRSVDWCDAWAYCAAASKHLCGAILTSMTASPKPTPFAQFDDPNVSQWRHACSYGPSPTWPYGSSADPSKCNTNDRDGDAAVAAPVPVRSIAACIGTPAELNALHDMSGNVAEWEDSCNGSGGETDACRVRGGSFRDDAANAACGVATTRLRGDRADWVGFRCCKF